MYRKLSESELSTYGITVTKTPKPLVEYLSKYYSGWSRCVVILDSEYDDQYYEHNTRSAIVFDEAGNEVMPSKENAVESRKNLPNAYELGFRNDQNDEPVEEVVYYNNMPDLYVKESDV